MIKVGTFTDGGGAVGEQVTQGKGRGRNLPFVASLKSIGAWPGLAKLDCFVQ